MIYSVVLINFLSLNLLLALPLSNDTGINKTEGIFMDKPVEVNNVTYIPKDLYVIRTLVYEIGILTDPEPNSSDDLEVLQDDVNIGYFQPPKNDSSFNWWQIFSSKLPQSNNMSDVAFERVIPIGMTLLNKPSEVPGFPIDQNEFYSTEEETEENEEENFILP